MEGQELLTPLERGTVEMYLDAELYDHEFRRRRHDVAWYRQLATDMASAYPQTSGTIIELGSGSGRLLVPLVRDGHRLIGVDLSRDMLRRCRDRLTKAGRKATSRALLLQADFRALPLQVSNNERFRLILCPFGGLHHLYTRGDLERFLSEVRRLLHPDGLFAFDVINPDPLWLSRDPAKKWSRTRFKHPRTGERLIYSTNHDYDPESQVLFIRLFYEPDLSQSARRETDRAALTAVVSPPRTVHLTQRQYFPAELEALLHYNGFTLWHRAGGFDGQPLSPVSAEQVICARVR